MICCIATGAELQHLPIGFAGEHRRIVGIDNPKFSVEFADSIVIGEGVPFGVISVGEHHVCIKGHDFLLRFFSGISALVSRCPYGLTRNSHTNFHSSMWIETFTRNG